jgi:ribosomal protein S18 acetylase RimI-like enzyme
LFKRIVQIFKKTFTDSYEPNEKDFIKRLEDKSNRFFFSYSETNQKEVSAVMILTDQNPVAHIDYLFVNQEIRGRGVGSKFLTDMLKFFKKEGRYTGLTLECETKLIDFYKKFQAQKIETYPSQFQDFEGLFNLMYIPINNSFQNEDIKNHSVESLNKYRKTLDLVVDHSTDKILTWRPKNHLSFREVKLDEVDHEQVLEKCLNLFKFDTKLREIVSKRVLDGEMRIFSIFKDETIISSSIIGVLKDKSFCHIHYFYHDNNYGVDINVFLKKLISYLSKSYDVLTVEFNKELVSLYKKVHKIDKLFHSHFFKYQKKNHLLQINLTSKNTHLKKEDLVSIMNEHTKDQKIVKETRNELLRHLLALKSKKN